MKTVIVVLVLAGVIFLVVYLTGSSVKEGFDPTQQGKEARAAIKEGDTWTKVMEVAGKPSKWKEGDSAFEFRVGYDTFEDKTQAEISDRLSKGDMSTFCLLYRFSEASTFAVNFDKSGRVMNIQDKESKADLTESMGGG